MKMKPELTVEQRGALDLFAAKYGAGWKVLLLNAWLNGTDAGEPSGHLLRQIRNQFGPKWLTNYEVTK